ncbi:iron uptake transporter permease EfeU [Gryllotalpicola sp.]|uniref:iron uptake transporter permease EfeU n=1 Tax=Gryllotalpicola sp. TaxID=1932787 RepID=UPI002612D267|nr:iron uptake transporter permease EfeU [Gryllotalpicola sp.]
MLATLVIGLREGLEAALIVGIIAAFLRQNGRRLTQMWIGVGTAVALAIAVGITLALVEQALPQAAQEMLETCIGAVAVFFVTSMLVWMNRHARNLKRELEAQAGAALRDGHALALAVMAFLAVLKEGFETSVFLLATFTTAGAAGLAATGAVVGILVSVGVGIGIYFGGIRIDLSKFFRITGAFLILVAGGLVIQALRTAHEAGWLNGGQQQLADFSSFAGPGTISEALLRGVLGIPTDPRLVEVVGWLLYTVPVALFIYWPDRRRVHGFAAAKLQFVTAVALAVIGLGVLGGVALAPQQSTASRTPASISLPELVALNGGRLPIGITAQTDPGPFDARWSTGDVTTVTLSGGGLATPRTVSIALPDTSATAAQQSAERTLWGVGLPAALLIGAAATAFSGIRSRRRALKDRAASSPDTTKERPAYALR